MPLTPGAAKIEEGVAAESFLTTGALAEDSLNPA